jgi:NADH-quinone oxidoreductase subunit A
MMISMGIALMGFQRICFENANMTLDQYLPVLLFMLIGIATGVAPQIIGYVLGPNRPDAAKNSPYECGFEAFGDARMQFDVRYYLIAILFILFDLETALLFPWAVMLKELGLFGFWIGLEIVTVLTIGFVYAWIKGALDWE